MAVNEMGLSTLGITFGYGVGSTKPATFKQLDRIVSIGEFSVSPATIDISCLEDLTSVFTRGRGEISDQIPVVVNWEDETMEQWEDVLDDFNNRTTGQSMWFEVIVPGMTKAAFFTADPPTALPVPSIEQNGAFTNTMNLVAKELKGWDTKVAFS